MTAEKTNLELSDFAEKVRSLKMDAMKAASEEKSHGPKFGKRHEQTLLYFLLVLIAYSIRVNLSVGIIAMTDRTASSNPDIPTYDWPDKSIVLSSFFWGYVLPQILAGHLANQYGPKWFLVASMTVCSGAGLLLPLLAGAFGSKGVMACRATQGLAQGFLFPSVHTLLAKWVPPGERSRLGTFVYAAGHFGTVVSMLLTGFIASSWYGWPMVFYSFSGAGLVWACIYALLGHNSPSSHPHITMEERFYIESSLGYGEDKPNSMLSALPYFVLWLLSFVFSYLADMCINKSILTIGACRKLFNSIGLIVPAIALVFLGNSDYHDADKAVALLVIAVGFNSAVLCGFNVNHIDISPNHSGTIMGITNGTSNIFGIIAPLVVQLLVTNENDPNQWKVVFYITSAIYVLASLVFVIFASGEVQPWNDEIPPNGKEKEKV